MTDTFAPSHLATLATNAAIDDLRTLLKSLDFWNAAAPPTVHLFCDAAVTAALPSIAYKGTILTKECLNDYTGLTRAEMERMAGTHYKNRFFDFVCEKLTLLDWVFETTPEATESGVLFCDADICFLGPLFKIPLDTELAVSPHMIRTADENRYGVYNAGMIWMKSPDTVRLWREACAHSTFYEQIAIGDIVRIVNKVYMIPVTENYGWWRLWQGRESIQELQSRWGLRLNTDGAGITISYQPLGSVHTHFGEKRDAATVEYNRWVLAWLRNIAKTYAPTRKFLEHLGFATK